MNGTAKQEAPASLSSVKWLLGFLWYGLLVLAALWIIGGPVYEAARRIEGPLDVPAMLRLATAVIGLVLTVVLFLLVAGLARWSLGQSWAAPVEIVEQPPTERVRIAFPAPVTLVAGGGLIVATMLSLAALMVIMARPVWIELILGGNRASDIDDVLVTMLSGAVGGSVSAMIAYLKHASEKKDFDSAYLPWYFARPLLGLLVGLIGFFLFKAGLLVTVPNAESHEFNNYGLAALGSLIGLFSKNALEKMKDIFHTTFLSRADVETEIKKAQESPPAPAQPEKKAN